MRATQQNTLGSKYVTISKPKNPSRNKAHRREVKSTNKLRTSQGMMMTHHGRFPTLGSGASSAMNQHDTFYGGGETLGESKET